MASGAPFTAGSTMRHVVVTTSTGALGLMAIFAVDFVDMLFISMLGEVELAAAIGYGATILFFTTSICIAIAIAMGALVSQRIGAGDRTRAKRAVANVAAFALMTTIPIAALVIWWTPWLLTQLGAAGRAHDLAADYLYILVPAMPILALAMAAGGVLRGVGDPKRAMYATLGGGLINAILDPILIFALNLDLHGAALASVAARVTVFAIGYWNVVHRHDMLGGFQFRAFARDFNAIIGIALPAMATNIATPLANAYVTATVARFGDEAVAGYSIIGRLIPVAFGVVFAMSGAIGPIYGQNYGAQRFDRVRTTLRDSLLFLTVYILGIWLLLILLQNHIVALFGLGEAAGDLVRFYCLYLAPGFLFLGGQFVAHAAFNNLGRATWSTLSNWGRATLGTVPFVWAGAALGGPEGAMLGQAVGYVIAGTAAIYAGLYLVRGLESGQLQMRPEAAWRRFFRVPLWPQTSYKGWTGQYRGN